ncbi:transcriptional regulator [Deferribacterales bacterium]|nr:transcriptional regulator [Deferribacterales bacterium]
MKGKTDINITVGNNIKRERLYKGVSQERLSELAGVHRTYIGMIERAERNITVSSLLKIANALNIDIAGLLK